MSIIRKQTQWRVYKPNKSNTGAASRLEMKTVITERGDAEIRDVQLFWVASPQTGTDEKGQ